MCYKILENPAVLVDFDNAFIVSSSSISNLFLSVSSRRARKLRYTAASSSLSFSCLRFSLHALSRGANKLVWFIVK